MRILRKHDDWLIVEKPAGWLVHPTKPTGEPTLLSCLQAEFPGEFLAMVNRLDRETSGLVLVARHAAAASILGKMTQARQIQKTYCAFVAGRAPDEGVIDAPLDRLGKHQPFTVYVKQGVWPGGYASSTTFRSLEIKKRRSGETVSWLEVKLGSGRLHQIRAHLSFIGLSVVGDKIYGPDEQCYLDFIRDGWTEKLEERLWFRRAALHASKLSFDWQGEVMTVESEMPADMVAFWSGLIR